MDGLPCSLLIPAAGESVRYQHKTSLPKGALRFVWNGKRRTMLEHIIPQAWNGEVLIGCQHVNKSTFINRLPSRYLVVPMSATSGQAETVVSLALSADPGYDVIVVNSDNAFDPGTLEKFLWYCRAQEATVGALVFRPTENLDRYGYVDDCPRFTCGAEKVAISPYALAGAFYFSSPEIIIRHAGANTRYVSEWFMGMPRPKVALEIHPSMLHEWGTAECLEADPSVDIHWSIA